jgi:hypothetical protein
MLEKVSKFPPYTRKHGNFGASGRQRLKRMERRYIYGCLWMPPWPPLILFPPHGPKRLRLPAHAPWPRMLEKVSKFPPLYTETWKLWGQRLAGAKKDGEKIYIYGCLLMLPGPPLILFRLQAPNGCAHLRHPDTSFLRLRFSAQAPRAILTPWLPVAVLRCGNRQPAARHRQTLLSVDAQRSPTRPRPTDRSVRRIPELWSPRGSSSGRRVVAECLRLLPDAPRDEGRGGGSAKSFHVSVYRVETWKLSSGPARAAKTASKKVRLHKARLLMVHEAPPLGARMCPAQGRALAPQAPPQGRGLRCCRAVLRHRHARTRRLGTSRPTAAGCSKQEATAEQAAGKLDQVPDLVRRYRARHAAA